jgi:carboxymethylenebutenolidase
MNAETSEGWIELQAADGHRLDAFRVSPRGESRGNVVVVQEIFGVNEHIRNVTRRVAREGYAAIAPALFDRQSKKIEIGYDQAGIDRGLAIRASIASEKALLDIGAALAQFAGERNAVVIGFCWGGTLAWLSAGQLPVRGAVAYYGGQIGSLLDVAPMAPVIAHFGDQDHSIPMSVPQAISERYPTVVNHIYHAGHGFNCDERGSFHAESAALAWERTTGFLRALF